MRHRSFIKRTARGGVNVTPMIDVVMCLIVFYLMVGQLAIDRRGDVVVPSSVTGDEREERVDALTINVARDGRVTIGGEEIPADRIAGELAGRLSRAGGAPVMVRADERAGFGALRPVLDALGDAGATNVELITRRGEGGAR